MDTMKFVVSLQCRIVLTILMLIIYGLTAAHQASPNDLFAPLSELLFGTIHNAVIPVIVLYWILGFVVNKYIYGNDF